MRAIRFLAVALALLTPELARAQAIDPQQLYVRAVRRDTIKAGATVTAAFVVTNERGDTADVAPSVETPRDWTVLMGRTHFQVAGRATEMLMLSVAVPARAAAGVYPIRVSVTSSADPRGTSDSILVVVPPRRALELTPVDRPGFVVSGRNYDASFLLRNRGNLTARVRITLRSSLSTALTHDTVVTLEAEESRELKTRVRSRPGIQAATDDVLEISATQVGDTAAPAEASARVTIVPEPSRKIEEYLKVPVHANLRAANTDGVSPFEITGSGYVRDGSPIRAEFLFRGKTGEYSAFGERDEYRLQLFAPSWRARVGDHFFTLSPLTGGIQPGFGAGIEASRGIFSAGAHGQQFRRDPLGGGEAAAYAAANPFEGARVQLNAVNRTGGLQPGRLAGGMASFARDRYHADVEVTQSSSDATRNGMARSARVGAAYPAFSFDLGHSFADTSFVGAQRGSQHNYLTGTAAAGANVMLGTNISSHRTDLSRATGVSYVEHLDIGSVSATFFERYTLELQNATRGATITGVASEGTQHGVRLRGDHDVRVVNLSLEAEAGRATDGGDTTRQYTHVSLGARRALQRGSVAMWGERYSGGSLTKGALGSTTLGGDATLRVFGSTSAMLMGYATRTSMIGAGWHSQLDARITHGLANGSTISLRARVLGGGAVASRDQSVAYLEYGMPLRVPVSRLRTPGRVRGRVVDAVSGTGVPGALVRLGPQVAITDRNGEVAFGGVPGGEHRLSMSQETSFADAVFVGDPTVSVDSAQPEPTTFQLAIARGARVNIAARRFVAKQTGFGGAADSLADAGPLANATLVLTGERDTLYRTTGENGLAAFTDVPPGHWVIAIRGDAPAFHRFDPDRKELVLKPGETQLHHFRLVPRRREVQLIGDGQELKSTTADPKGQTPQGAVKVVKPDIKQDKQ